MSTLNLPRLPVADWHLLGKTQAPTLPAIDGLSHLLATTSGRAAIGLALEILGVGANDRVLVPTYHCPTMVSPVIARGAIPRFFPIDSRGHPRLDRLESPALRTARAIVAPHYFGIPRPMSELRAWCDDHGIALIEDCAHAFFGMVEGRAVGSWGDFAIASLTKFFPVPEGGYLASATRPINLELSPAGLRTFLRACVDTLELSASYGRFQPLSSTIRGLSSLKRWIRRPVRQSATPDDATPQDALFDGPHAHRRPSRVVSWIVRNVDRQRLIAARRRNYKLLASRMANVRGARALEPELPESSAPYVFPVWVDDPDSSYQAIRSAGVPVFRWDVRWPGTPFLADDAGSAWSHHVFQIGCHQDLSEQDIDSISSVLISILNRKKSTSPLP